MVLVEVEALWRARAVLGIRRHCRSCLRGRRLAGRGRLSLAYDPLNGLLIGRDESLIACFRFVGHERKIRREPEPDQASMAERLQEMR